jgi:fermentation-respiration switch protein FrsA (DUF1100 family)
VVRWARGKNKIMEPKRQKRWLKRGGKLALLLGVLYVMLHWFEHSQVYHPTGEFDTEPGAVGLRAEDAVFQAADGVKLHGWFFPALPDSSTNNLVFLVSHGNGGNISHRLGQARALLQTGAAVLLYDYRGYGRSAGRPNEKGTYLDAQAAGAWLRQKGFAAANIISYGESLGGAVAAELAVSEPVGGLVLQSTFTSVPNLGSELFPWLPVRWLGTIKYDTLSKLPRVTVPVLVMHSRRDSLIGFQHAERNFAAAREPKLFAELRGDHNDPVWEEPAYVAAVGKFLEATKLSQAGAATPPNAPVKP